MTDDDDGRLQTTTDDDGRRWTRTDEYGRPDHSPHPPSDFNVERYPLEDSLAKFSLGKRRSRSRRPSIESLNIEIGGGGREIVIRVANFFPTPVDFGGFLGDIQASKAQGPKGPKGRRAQGFEAREIGGGGS